MKGSDSIYSIFGKDITTGKDISENVEKIYIDWIFDAFEHYKNIRQLDVRVLMILQDLLQRNLILKSIFLKPEIINR